MKVHIHVHVHEYVHVCVGEFLSILKYVFISQTVNVELRKTAKARQMYIQMYKDIFHNVFSSKQPPLHNVMMSRLSCYI